MIELLTTNYQQILVSLLATGLLIVLTRKLAATIYLLSQPKTCLKLTPTSLDSLGINQHCDLITSLAALNSQSLLTKLLLGRANQLSFEIAASYQQGIQLRLVCWQSQLAAIKSLLEARYPGIKLQTTDHLALDSSWRLTNFGLSSHWALPLRPLQPDQAETPNSFLRSAVNDLDKSEGFCLQLACQPKRPRAATRLTKKLLTNAPLKLNRRQLAPDFVSSCLDKLINSLSWLLSEIVDPPQLATAPNYQAGPSKNPAKPDRQLSQSEQAIFTAVEAKLNQPLFKTSLRLALKTANPKSQLATLKAALNVFTNQPQSWQIKGRLLSQALRRWQLNQALAVGKDYLAAAEIANLWSLPNGQAEGLNKQPSRPLPVSLASRNQSQFEVVIGSNSYRDKDSPIGLTLQERQRHQYIVGGTGSGKTTMLKHQIIQDIKAGRGLAVLDPHGDLAQDILGYIPKSRLKDVVYIDPSDLDHPVGINLLELPPNLKGNQLVKQKDLVTEAVISVARKLFSEEDEGGHRIEYILRNTIQTALYLDEPTLFSLYWLLNNRAYRHRAMRKITDPALKLFWGQEMRKAGNMQWLKLTIGITAKIGRFLFSASAREILSQPKSTINFDKLLDDQKIVICNLAKGKLGEDTSALLGTTILTKLQLAALRRVDQAQDQRKPFYIYVDEFQNFATISFAQMLSEARKYQVFLIMAEQSPKQHKQTRLIDIILANVGTVVAFRSGSAKDAQLILPLFQPDIDEHQLLNLESYNFYTKIAAQKTQTPMSGTTILPTKQPDPKTANQVIKTSRKLYTKDNTDV